MATVPLAQTNYYLLHVHKITIKKDINLTTYKVKIYRKRKFSVSDNCTIDSIGNHKSTDIIYKWNDLHSNNMHSPHA